MVPFSGLSDGTVRIRPLEMQDAPAMYAAVCESLEELKPWMTWAHDNYRREETRDWIHVARERWLDGHHFGFAVTDVEQGDFLGSCSLSHINPVYRFCNLGYWIRTSRRGQGFAVRATRLAARFAFERLGLFRTEIVIAPDNRASLRVAEKSGAFREGILRNRLTAGRQVQDAVMFSFIPQDFGLQPPSDQSVQARQLRRTSV
jgi:ribosomal-protein-serine acetyltransferase